MKFTATLLALAIAAVSFSQTPAPAAGPSAKATPAQTGHKKQDGALSKVQREKIRDEVLVELKISADKVIKIKDLDSELKGKAKAAHKASQGLLPEDKKKQMKELHEWYTGKLKGILGEEDFKKFSALLKDKVKAARKAAATK